MAYKDDDDLNLLFNRRWKNGKKKFIEIKSFSFFS